MSHSPLQSAASDHSDRAATAAQPQRPHAGTRPEDQRAHPRARSKADANPLRADAPDTQPCEAVPAQPRDTASALRALRVLEILRARTDARAGLSSTELVARLAHPDDPRLPAISTSRSSVRASITALKTAGFDICASNKTGYALRTHPLADADAELIVGAICESATLSAEQRGRLLDRVLGLASPTVRHRLLARGPDRPRIAAAGPSHAVLPFAFRTAGDLIRHAVHQGLPCSFELADAGETPGRRHRLMPTALFERGGARFMTGTVIPTACDGSSSQRVFHLDRLRRLAVLGSDDSLLMTPDALQ